SCKVHLSQPVRVQAAAKKCPRSPGNCSGKYHTKDLGGITTTKEATDGVESALQ
ncbi:hypothetical protein Tco_1478597, partial [Tanacetum coccineum]